MSSIPYFSGVDFKSVWHTWQVIVAFGVPAYSMVKEVQAENAKKNTT